MKERYFYTNSWFLGLIVLMALLTFGMVLPPISVILLIVFTFLSGVFILLGFPAPVFLTLMIVYIILVLMIHIFRKRLH